MSKHSELKDLLTQDIRQLEALAAILDQEKSCLATSDIQTLDTLTRDKNVILDQVRERARQKIRTLVEMGYNPKSGTPSRFIRSTGMDELTDLWAEAEQRLQTCQDLNSNNGRILSHLQKRLARLTDIFRGSHGQQKLYGSQGQQTSVSQSNILASA